MTALAFTCPQCLLSATVDADAKFCPRCGLAIGNEKQAAQKIVAGPHKAVVLERIAYGDVANVYRCEVPGLRREGVFKIARTEASNRHVLHEQQILDQLHTAADEKLAAFLPRVLASLNYAQPDEPAQRAHVLVYHEQIHSPRELYTLDEVHTAYPNGLDPRDMAWMWRRLLTVLGFVHRERIAHTTITPDHVLIEPRDHKLVLIGWCGAVRFGQVPHLTPARWRDWGSWNSAASPSTDLACAARTMSYLLGPNPEPAIARHLERAQGSLAESSSNAIMLLDDFDRLIEALWGPRQVRAFQMPARRV